MAKDDVGNLQLFQQKVTANSATRLSDAADGIVGYALSPNGRLLAYTTPAKDGSTEIWLLQLNRRSSQLLYTCQQANCTQLFWAPDNRRLVFEKQTFASSLSEVSLWWLDVQTQESVPILPDATHPARSASLSPNGEWLSYAVPSEERHYLYRFDNGRYFFVQSMMGTPAVWHPNGKSLLIGALDVVVFHGDEGDEHQEHSHDYSEAVHLFSVDIDTESRQSITNTPNIDDGAAVYSPDGEWILFGRKPVRTNNGRQLWLMRSDGTETRPLTDDLIIHHGAASWSANGRYILYQTFNTQQPENDPQIWMMEVESGETTLIAASGFLPQWLP